MRENLLPTALLNGSVALLASLYFSRVVHPNYLIPLAVLLPLALLARGRAADGVVVPLMLLLAGVEAVENGAFRLTWDQAVAVGWPRTLSGLSAALLPRSAPGLTADPIGTGFSALAAGLALAYLIAVALGASSRVRLVLGAIAVALVVVLPAALVIGISGRTGIRGQDAWVVQAPADASRLVSGASPYALPAVERPHGREAWSSSFRLEPARVLVPDRPRVPPGSAALAAPLRGLGLRDPRWLSLLALAGVAVLVLHRLYPEQRPLALGILALSVPVTFGAVFGSPMTFVALLVSGAWLASLGAGAISGGVLLGTAAAVSGLAFAVVPFLARPRGADTPTTRRTLGALALSFTALCLPAALLDPAALLSAVSRTDDIAPGLGLVNVVLYRGLENVPVVRLLFASVPLIGLVAVALLLRYLPAASQEGKAALAVLLVLFLIPSVSPEAVVLPIVLGGLPYLRPREPE
jgi:hypothetical protein